MSDPSKDEPVQEEPEVETEVEGVVKLPPQVTPTGEEDEELKLTVHCKTFRFDEGENEWKERGVGPMKLLKHKTLQQSRMLHRREHVLKVCVSINLGECGPLLPGPVPDKTWVVSGMDYSDDPEESQHETICMKFSTKEDADSFKKMFEELGGPKA